MAKAKSPSVQQLLKEKEERERLKAAKKSEEERILSFGFKNVPKASVVSNAAVNGNSQKLEQGENGAEGNKNDDEEENDFKQDKNEKNEKVEKEKVKMSNETRRESGGGGGGGKQKSNNTSNHARAEEPLDNLYNLANSPTSHRQLKVDPEPRKLCYQFCFCFYQLITTRTFPFKQVPPTSLA